MCLPKLGSERRRCREVSKLSTNALKEETTQALAADCWYA